MPDLDPRYGAYGPVAALTLATRSGMGRMTNPAVVAIALANATAALPGAPYSVARKACGAGYRPAAVER
jgi:hypothetical protein